LSLLAAVPVILLAFPTGPGPGRTGAPGDTGHCAGGSCHVGAAARGEGAAIYLPFGAFYEPGVPQRILVHVTGQSTEPITARYGFQLSARLGSNPAVGSGGALRALGNEISVQCGDGRPPGAAACPPGDPLYFAQHSRPSREPLWELEWTPPADARGPIEFYLAVNAANGLGDQFGDRIFLNSFAANPAGPLHVRQPFGGGGASPNAWIEIYGNGLAGAGGVRVTVGGREAHIGFAGPGQINALLAADVPLGLQTLTVTTAGSAPISSPILVTATSPSLYPELPAVAPGRTAVLYATGCGALTGPAAAELRMNNRVTPATAYASPAFPGLCQFQFEVPDIVPNPYLLHACIGGRCNGQRLLFTVAEK